MTTSARFRYVHEIVGVWVLLTLALLVAAVLLTGRAQRWFERQEDLRTRFPADGTFGLQPGAEVHILGTPVGTVRHIEVEEDGSMHGLLRIRGDFSRFVREDSVAVIRRKFGVAGDAYIEITVGTGPPLVFDEKAQIPSRRDAVLTELAEEMIEQLRVAVIPLLEELDLLMASYRRLGEQLSAPEGELQRSLAHVEALLAGLERGEGTAGRLLKDPSAALEMETLLRKGSVLADDAQAVLVQVQGLLEDLAAAVRVAPEVAETVRGEMRDVPGLVLQTRSTLRETETLITGLQRHWLLRRAIETEDPVTALEVTGLAPPDPAKGGWEARP